MTSRWSSAGRAVRDLALPFAFLILFLVLGNALRSALHIWIPGSVLGMLLLFAVLSTGAVRASWLDRVADYLLDHMGLFFVCPGVEVISYLGLVRQHWLVLATVLVVSSVVTLAVSGWVAEKTGSPGEANGEGSA